jgi:hypothetical protein
MMIGRNGSKAFLLTVHTLSLNLRYEIFHYWPKKGATFSQFEGGLETISRVLIYLVDAPETCLPRGGENHGIMKRSG